MEYYLIENKKQYKEAIRRFDTIRNVKKGKLEYKEMQLLALLISDYENRNYKWPDVDPIEMIKIRMEEFSFTQVDLAFAYGDKATVSKVLNYKQPLSLKMIRIFSQLLRIPAQILIKEYELKK